MSRLARVQPPAPAPVPKPAPPPARRQDPALPEAAANNVLAARGDFCATGLGGDDIRDDDAARALATRWLVRELAPLLGLDPAAVRISTDADAARRTGERGASGLSEPGRIFLHPRRFQPHSAHGRYLLAHELTHAAQRQLSAPIVLPESAARRLAEREAHDAGTAFAGHQLPPRPRHRLPPQARAADSDAGAPLPEQDLASALAAAVATGREREIALIKELLSGLWVSDGDVDKVMQVLDGLAFPVAKAVVVALGDKHRYWLADNINPPHVYAHRRSVLATFAALPPAQASAIDLDVLRALPASGMSAEEAGAAADTLSKISARGLQDLLHSEKGSLVLSLLQGTRVSGDEQARMRGEAGEALSAERELETKRAGIAKHDTDQSAKSLLEQVRALLLAQAGPGQERKPRSADALAALRLLAQARSDMSRLDWVAERMEAEGLIDQLLQLLPPATFTAHDEQAATLMQLVQSRLPWKNARLVEGLLSYGLFDWAITQAEALFAYRVIKMLPLPEQYRFRQRDGGKWYLRLVDHLPQDAGGLEIRKAGSKEEIAALRDEGITVDETALLFNASERYQKKLQDQGASNTLRELVEAFRQARKGVYRDEEAKDLYRQLAALGGGTLRETPASQLLREAVVHELDRLGYIGELFAELPESFLYAEENRVSTVKIMLARDPARVRAHARELVSRGFTDWMVSDREAWLAYQCVRALPQDEREAFIADEPERWARIQAEMSASQRQSRDLNLFVDDKAGTGRASVLGQLADGRTWTGANRLLLDGLVRMAIAITEHRFAFERSREFNAVADRALQPLVDKYRLWNPAAGRSEYTPELLKGTRWYEEGVFDYLRTLGKGLLLVLRYGGILFVRHGAVDLRDVQDLAGGDLAGVHLAGREAGGSDANKAVVQWSGKSAEVFLPELVVDSANIQLAGATLQAGRIVLKNLRLQAAFDDQDLAQPAKARAELEQLDASDLLLARSASVVAVSRLLLRSLRLAAGVVDRGERHDGFLGFPLPLLDLLGRVMGGEEQAAAVEFSFASLSAEGLTTSDGRQVAKIDVTDFALRAGLNKAARLRAERASIGQRLARSGPNPELAGRLAQVEDDLATAEQDEREYLAIRRRLLKGSLSPGEQGKLLARLKALQFEQEGPAFIDVGAVTAAGIQQANGLQIDAAAASGISGGALLKGGLLDWQNWQKNLKDVDASVDTLEVSGVRDRSAGLLFEKATLTGGHGGIRDRGNEISAGAARLTVEGIGLVPRIGLLRQRLASLERKAKTAAPEDRPELEAQIGKLQARIAELQELADARFAAYQQLEQAKTPEQVEAAKAAVAQTDAHIVLDLAQYGAARVELDEFEGAATGAGDLLGDGFDLDRMLKGTVAVKARLRRLAVSGGNVQANKAGAGTFGGANFELGETRLDVAAQRNGTSVDIELKDFTIASFTLSDMLLTSDSKGIGMEIESAGATRFDGVHLDGTLRMEKKENVDGDGSFPSDFWLAHATVSAFRIDKVTAGGLVYRDIPQQMEVSLKSGTIAGIHANELLIDFPKTGADKLSIAGAAGIDAVSNVELGATLAHGWELQHGRISGTGLGFEFAREGAITVSAGDLNLASATLRGPDGWARFSLGHLSGTVVVNDGTFELKQVRLGSLKVAHIDWRAGERRIETDRPASIDDVRVSGKIVTTRLPPKSGKASGYPAPQPTTVVSSVSVSELSVGSIVAEHLVYRDADEVVEIGVPDKDLPDEMQGFRPLSVRGISLRNLEWDAGKGLDLRRQELDVKTFEAAAVYKDLKAQVSAGLALKGKDMGLTFAGPNFVTGSTGIIEKTGGFYKGKGVDTHFKTGQIVGGFTLTDKEIILNSLDIDDVRIGATTYTGAEGMEVGMGSAGIGHVEIGPVHAQLEPGKDERGRATKTISKISAESIVLTGIEAQKLRYAGKATSLDDKQMPVTKDTTLTADKAWIDRFTITGIEHDVAARLTTLAARIDSRDAGKSAFGVDGLVAKLVTHAGSKESAIRIATNLRGGTLTGKNISLQTVGTGKPGEAETRTAVGGVFQLERLSLLYPNVQVTDDKGRQTLAAKATLVELQQAALALKGHPGAEATQVLAAKARSLSVHGLDVKMKIDLLSPGSTVRDLDYTLRGNSERFSLKLKGKVGIDSNRSGKADEGDVLADLESDKAGDNEIEFPWYAQNSEQLLGHARRLRAGRVTFPGDDLLPPGRTGEATVTNIIFIASGFPLLTVRLYATEGKIVDIAFGDLAVFDQAPPAPQAEPKPAEAAP